MAVNSGDFQDNVYAEAVRGVNSRFPFDFATIERKASGALPDWVYRYVSAASGDGRTKRANMRARFSHFNTALAIRNFDFAGIMVPQNLLGIAMADLP
jgi:hypothetical protein